MTRRIRWIFAVTIGSTIGLAGCAWPNAGLSARITGESTPLSQIYAVDGQPQLIVKRRAGTVGTAKNLKRIRSTRIEGVEVDAVTDGNWQAALRALRADPSVEYAEPNFRVGLPETAETLQALGPSEQAVNFQGEYGPKLTRALEAFARTKGEGQVIAVVDTGVDLKHPDLAPKMVPGVNTVDANGSAADDQGHGTNVAGIAASLQDDAGGIVGMAPGAKIMPVKVLGGDGSGSDASVAEGIRWAADNGATVINLSLGGPSSSQTGASAVKYALSKGCVVVAAMGNDGTGGKSYPAAYPGVIAVGATDINDQVTSFSQYGSWISVSAPGYSILSTYPTYRTSSLDSYESNKAGWEKMGMRAGLKYGYMTGTSQAAPHVAGLAALVRAANPQLAPDQIKAKIEAAALKTSGMAGKPFDTRYGSGRIDALKSL